MNSFERVWRRLRGEPVDRPPNFDIFMAVAARYLGQPIRDFYLDYRVLCEANLALHRDFSVDVLSTMSDPYHETADWGAEIEFLRGRIAEEQGAVSAITVGRSRAEVTRSRHGQAHE